MRKGFWRLKRCAPAALFVSFAIGAIGTSGCAPLLVASGVAAGYAVSRDSVILDLDKSWESVWNACVDEVKYEGRLKRENRKRSRIDARIRDVDVVLTLEQLTPATVRVVIRARKHLLPRVEVAQRLGLGIARRMG